MNKLELNQAGYEHKGQAQCSKCQQTVEKYENDLGKKIFINLDTHPDHPGWLHSLDCGKDPEKDFQQAYPQQV